MKKILYTTLTLSILLIGCSKEEDSIQHTEETHSNLDQDLFGIWKNPDWYYNVGTNNHDYYNEDYQSFSSNGRWSTWTIITDLSLFSTPMSTSQQITSWWVQDNYIFSDFQYQGPYEYSISADTLTLIYSEQDTTIWFKQ